MQIHFKTLGCRLNEAEIESWAQQFESRGHFLSASSEMADLLVINTCAVTGEAVKKSRQLIRKMHRNNPKAKLVVSGCYASLDKSLQEEISAIDLIIENEEKDRLVDIILKELDFDTMPVIAMTPGESVIFKRGRNRAFVKIQDGCRYQCTFCIVTTVRGNERSRAEKTIIDEINQIHAQGIQEVVLTGVHVGGYGSDIDSSLYQLIQGVLKDTDIPRIRLASIEPWDLPDLFVELFNNKRLMPHMHLPLQSGCNSVLKRMGRRCKTIPFRRLIERARTEIEKLNVTTDVIVGFPGETENEWEESKTFIEEIGFSHIHIFTYSKRDGTRAAALPNQVCSKIKKKRSRELHELTRKMRYDFLSRFVGKTHPVLWENKNHAQWNGYTDNFIRVELNDRCINRLENLISDVRIIGVDENAEKCVAQLV